MHMDQSCSVSRLQREGFWRGGRGEGEVIDLHTSGRKYVCQRRRERKGLAKRNVQRSGQYPPTHR